MLNTDNHPKNNSIMTKKLIIKSIHLKIRVNHFVNFEGIENI